MDQFGVKKPSLKAIARTPIIPALGGNESKRKGPPIVRKMVWLGATLKDLRGEDFSAYGVSKEVGGVALATIPQNSAASKAGLKEGDLIQAVNGRAVKNGQELFKVIKGMKGKSIKLKVISNQQAKEVSVKRLTLMHIEASGEAGGFKMLKMRINPKHKVSANTEPSNQSVSVLTDGKLEADYGAVFPNGEKNGVYKMDLGGVKPVSAVTSWSFNQGNKRGAQSCTIYGSSANSDPGWDLKKFAPLGTIDTGPQKEKFIAASLEALEGESLGEFRWIVWAVSPVSTAATGENTAFQELAVKVSE